MNELGWAVAATATVLVLVAVLAELLARWWVRHRKLYYVFPPGLRLLIHPHPVVSPHIESSVRFEVNSDGERGSEVPRLRPGQKLYRALVIGGSQPEGYLLDQDTCWPGALHRLLQDPQHLMRLGASRAHVGSIARSGVGSEALALILERVLPRYPRLQAIIILVGASDALRWMEQGARAVPPSTPGTADVFRCHPELAFAWRPKALALVELARRSRRRWLRPVDVHRGTGEWIRNARAMRSNAKIVRRAMPDPAPMLDNFERQLGQVLRMAKAHAERVLVIRQPWFDRECTAEEAAQMWQGAAGQAWKDDVATYFSLDVLSRLMALIDERARRVVEESEVEQVDLRPVLRPSLETYYDFFHATPAGARTVAQVVAMAMARRPLPAAKGREALARVSA